MTGTTTPTQTAAAAREAWKTVDALGELQSRLLAYEAIKEMVLLERADAEQSMPLLRRESLAMLLMVVNEGVGRSADAAFAQANVAAVAQRAGAMA